jgi:hypothetical protein
LSADYFSIPEEEIKHLESLLTVVGGKVVYAANEFSKLAPPALPVSPDWSPVKRFGGYARVEEHAVAGRHSNMSTRDPHQHQQVLGESGLWTLGCDCFAF